MQVMQVSLEHLWVNFRVYVLLVQRLATFANTGQWARWTPTLLFIFLVNSFLFKTNPRACGATFKWKCRSGCLKSSAYTKQSISSFALSIFMQSQLIGVNGHSLSKKYHLFGLGRRLQLVSKTTPFKALFWFDLGFGILPFKVMIRLRSDHQKYSLEDLLCEMKHLKSCNSSFKAF